MVSIAVLYALLQKPVNVLGFDPVEPAQVVNITDVQRIIGLEGVGVYEAVQMCCLDNRGVALPPFNSLKSELSRIVDRGT